MCSSSRFVQTAIMMNCSARANGKELDEPFVVMGDGLSELSIEFCSYDLSCSCDWSSGSTRFSDSFSISFSFTK